MGTTQQTVINFTAKELTEKLKRIHAKMRIMHAHKDSIHFPYMARLADKRRIAPSLPSDECIIQAVERAQEAAHEALLNIGIRHEDINLADSINSINNIPEEVEFVNVEFTDFYMDGHEDTAIGDYRADNEYNNDEIEAEGINGTEAQHDLEVDINCNNVVYDAAELIPNYNDTLNLKSSTVGEKYCFRIRDSTGTVKVVKKSTFLWLITTGKYRLSSDRSRRFIQREFT